MPKNAIVSFSLAVAFSPYGQVQLGRKETPPEYSFASWFAMLFAGGIGTIIAMLFSENLIFRLAFAITYLAVVWICLEAVKIPDLRDLIKQGYETTMRITCMVTFILIGSTCFSVVFLGVSGGVWLEHMLTSLPGGVWGFLIFINIFIFFLAFFLDFFEIAFIILPMIAPIAQKVLAPVAKPLEIDGSKQPFVILVVGVNGSGKTTTIGKLAAKLSAEGRKIGRAHV